MKKYIKSLAINLLYGMRPCEHSICSMRCMHVAMRNNQRSLRAVEQTAGQNKTRLFFNRSCFVVITKPVHVFIKTQFAQIARDDLREARCLGISLALWNWAPDAAALYRTRGSSSCTSNNAASSGARQQFAPRITDTSMPVAK